MSHSHRKDGREKTAEINKLKNELATCQARLKKGQTLMLDGELKAADYNDIKATLEPEIGKIIRRLNELCNGNLKGEDEIVAFGFQFLNNLPERLTTQV